MVRSKLMLAVACATLLACTSGMTQRERMLEQQAVEDRLATWVRVTNNAQVDSLVGLYSPETRVLWSNGNRSEGIEQYGADIREFYGAINYMNFVLQDPTTQILAPGVAVSYFRHSTDIVAAGGLRQPVSAGHGSLVWVKDPSDNLWKIHIEHISISRPSPF